MRKKNRVKFYILNISIPLIIGFVIYLLWGKGTYIVELLNIVPLGLKCDTWWKDILRNYFADMLWAYTLTMALRMVLGEGRRNLIISAIMSILLGAIVELLQYKGLISGTFDYLDILVEMIAAAVAIIIISLVLEDKNAKIIKRN